MRLPLIVFSAMVLVGCDGYQSPPTRPTAIVPKLEALALEDGAGKCIEGATIELIKAQTVVETGRHTPYCFRWDGGGALFVNVTYGETVTLRASAAGYQTEEQTVVVIDRDRPGTVILTLRRIQ